MKSPANKQFSTTKTCEIQSESGQTNKRRNGCAAQASEKLNHLRASDSRLNYISVKAGSQAQAAASAKGAVGRQRDGSAKACCSPQVKCDSTRKMQPERSRLFLRVRRPNVKDVTGGLHSENVDS